MNSVKIKGLKFKLVGEIIQKNQHLEFIATNQNNETVNIKDIQGKKIISVFPDINTKVCDAQTREISKLANKYPHVHFISLTNDTVEQINKWCHANNINNIMIWSDRQLGDFARQTNAMIKRIKKLARGFLILNEKNDIIDLDWNQEIAEAPNYKLVEKYLQQ